MTSLLSRLVLRFEKAVAAEALEDEYIDLGGAKRAKTELANARSALVAEIERISL